MLIPAADEPRTSPEPNYNVVAEPAPTTSPPAESPTNGASPPAERERPLTNHGDGPLPRNADFFAEPPPEIGPLVSAHTTLLAGARPWTPGARMVAEGCVGLLGLGAGALVVLIFTPGAEFWHFLWPTVGSLLGVAIGVGLTRFSHTCTYVGREGVARFRCGGRRDRITGCEVFRFRDALELRTSQTSRYVNGVYRGTDYSFTWTDVGGRTRYTIDGTYQSAKGQPPPTDPYHYGLAAEMAWTFYLLGQVPRQLELAGYVAFNLRGGHSVTVAPKALTARLGGEPVEWSAEDIEAVVLDKGVIKIKRTDAREGWFSASGVIKFPYDTLANARLFLHLMNKLVGVRVG
jgi:hypothetical protein